MAARSAIVTGASRGIGLAICRSLALDGFELTMVARDAEQLDAARREVEAAGGVATAHAGNVADESDLAAIEQGHRERHGSLDVLVNNAGMGVPSSLSALTSRQIDVQLDVNLRSVIMLTQTALPLLRASAAQSGRALVVNLASIAGKVGTASLSVYAAAKHGIVGFTDSMNRELYESGIRFAALCPGFVDTALSDYARDRLTPTEMIQPQDVAEAVRFLLRLSPACLVPEIVFLEAAALGLRPEMPATEGPA